MASQTIETGFSLAGKRALIIGADHPVGRAAAITLAEAGAKIAIASCEVGSGAELAAIARETSSAGAKPIVHNLNASIRADVDSAVQQSARELGRLDILVNAIDAPWYGAAESADDGAFDAVIGGNLRRVWMACQAAGRVMIPQGTGVIVNLTSVLAQRGVPHASLYCAAKAAVLNLTRALAIEWARAGIRVNAIEAGWLDEAKSPARASDEFEKNLLKYLPEKRLIKPEDLSGALLYLVSPAAGFVTGESIAVDGGLLCRV